jgi:dienelactone hydrolase
LKLVSFLSALIFSLSSFAATETVIEYKDGKTVLEGVLFTPEKADKALPAVIVVHEWMGLNDYAKKRARQLADMGYVAFAADIYGKGVRAKDVKEASELSSMYKSDRKLLRSRINAALSTLRKQKGVDRKNISAIGYCFGGTTVLELARSGADVRGVVSFHGGLSTPTPEDGKKIKSKVLVLHGGVDPYVPATEVEGFYKEMNDAKVDYQFVAYANTVHSFTNPEAGNDPSKGAAYNPSSDKRSFEAMSDFLKEVSQ